MFLSTVHGSLLKNLTNSKMEKYLHRADKPGSTRYNSGSWWLTESLEKVHPSVCWCGTVKVFVVYVCVFNIQAPLRSSFFYGSRRTKWRPSRRHYGKSISFHLVMALLHHLFHLMMINKFCFRRRAISCGVVYTKIHWRIWISLFLTVIRFYVFPRWPGFTLG